MGAPAQQPTPSMEPGYTNPVKPADYSAVDFTQTGPGAGYKAAQDANMAQFSQAAMQAANQQALSNVRGIGGQYGALGAANSGAAYAAAAQGANAPLYAAQTQIAGMGQQNINDLYSQFSGVVAPQYMQTPSPYEQEMGNLALQQSRKDAQAS
jgi:hypothetical protein